MVPRDRIPSALLRINSHCRSSETYSVTNDTIRVLGNFKARNDIEVRCGLEAEDIVLRNDIKIRGDVKSTHQIAVRNDAHFLGAIKTETFKAIQLRYCMKPDI